ncbi:putative MFS amine transporter [Trichodelitschia bisporula]|uniref:Putative MFS amine transporter n=1 Tax=Trichodelitschia bisporula TaxID=703511 RepID=A0A6G1HZW7_9PEZI|nr:putative MFS amine transporter [Trichodelitschia bisporula]
MHSGSMTRVWCALRGDGGVGRRPWALKHRSSKWFILTTIVCAIFTDIFLYAVIVPVIPFALTSRADIEEHDIQKWVTVLVAVYGGALSAFSPIAGWLSDHSSSRRLPLVCGLLALLGGTLLLNLGSSIGVFIAARILQGLSAAVVWVAGLALLADTVSENEVGEMFGYVLIAMSVALLLGPLLGGIVFERAGYNEVYAMVYALIGLDVAMRLLVIEKKVAKRWECVEEGSEGDVETARDTADVETKPEGDLTARNTSHAASTPTPPATPVKHAPAVLTLLKSRRLLCALWGTMVTSVVMTQFDSTLPLHVQQTFGWNATGAGLIFIPFVLPSIIAPIVGWATDRYGPRWLATAGFALLTPLQVLLRFVTHNTLSQKALLCALLALMGLALNLALPPITVEITSSVTRKERATPGLFGTKGAYAQAYGLFNTAWAAGALVGPIWAGFVRDARGWGTMTWSLAVLPAVSVVPVAVWTGGYAFKVRRE